MRAIATLLGALLLAGLPAGSAGADDFFESAVVGIQVPGQMIAGIGGGGNRWKVAEGEAEIGEYGELEVEVEGLLLDGGMFDGTVGPISTVFASLVCQKTGAGDLTNEVVASTADFPLSAAGDAEIEETIALPAVCVAPIVLIRVRMGPAPWIAASGF